MLRFIKTLIIYLSCILIEISVKCNFPQAAGLICAIWTKNISKHNKCYNVLYLSKPVFNDDVDSLNEYGKIFSYLKFPRLFLAKICNSFIPNFNLLNDANYNTANKGECNIRRLRKYLTIFLKTYRKLRHFDIVLTGNFVYTREQEFIRVLRQHMIPVVVIYKEGMFPLNNDDNLISIFYTTKIFQGSKILFYNESIKNLLLKAKIKGLTEYNASVVGVPRFDISINQKNDDQDSCLITLFSYDANAKSEYLVDDNESLIEFQNITINFHKILAEFTLKNKQFKLIVKSKTSPKAYENALNIFSPYKKYLKDRLIICKDHSAGDLIRRSNYIAGFSSTTLIEALLVNRVLISPNYTLKNSKKVNDLFSPYDTLTNYVKNIDELSEIILNPKSRITPSKMQRISFLKQRLFKSDGKTALRVEKEMKSLL